VTHRRSYSLSHVRRAIAGSVVGSALTFLLGVAGPQSVQRLLVIGSTGWPVAIGVAGVAAFLAGFVGNAERPGSWSGLAVWMVGWVGGVLLGVLVVILWSEGD
jgi:hypothetical protein